MKKQKSKYYVSSATGEGKKKKTMHTEEAALSSFFACCLGNGFVLEHRRDSLRAICTLRDAERRPLKKNKKNKPQTGIC